MQFFVSKRKRQAIWTEGWAQGFAEGLEVAPVGKVLIPAPDQWPLHARLIDKDLRFRNAGGERTA